MLLINSDFFTCFDTTSSFHENQHYQYIHAIKTHNRIYARYLVYLYSITHAIPKLYYLLACLSPSVDHCCSINQALVYTKRITYPEKEL